jgi:uncharacterized damage-inducible protein DinB
MRETQRIADQLRRVHEGGAWHGSSLREILAGVTNAQAARRPIPGAHSIWDIVSHITQWDIVVRKRLAGERIVTLPPQQDWPAVRDPGARAWRKALANLQRSHRELCAAIVRFPVRRFSQMVPGRKYSYYRMLHGIAHHDAYHAGQIALLKKAFRASERRKP